MLAVNDCNRIFLINSTKTRLARAVHRALFSVVLAAPLATVMVRMKLPSGFAPTMAEVGAPGKPSPFGVTNPDNIYYVK